jgi:hypothetical protein
MKVTSIILLGHRIARCNNGSTKLKQTRAFVRGLSGGTTGSTSLMRDQGEWEDTNLADEPVLTVRELEENRKHLVEHEVRVELCVVGRKTVNDR